MIKGAKSLLAICSLLLPTIVFSGCSNKPKNDYSTYVDDNYRNYYHIFVSQFADSNNDGIGDLKGITENLDYLRDIKDPHSDKSLGINGIFLSPIHKAPSYHKYDTTDYLSIDPTFGTLADFEELMKEAHKRGIRVILDGVFNHVSTGHPLFLKAVKELKDNQSTCTRFKASGELSSACYKVAPTAKRFRFMKKGVDFIGYANRSQTTGLDELAEYIHYEGFASGMVDLDLDNEENKAMIKEYIDFFMAEPYKVDGFRLDAVQSYYGEEQIDIGRNCQFINFINATVKANNPDAYIVAEGPWGSAASTYQQESDIESYFNFPISVHGFGESTLDYSLYKENGLKAEDVFSYFNNRETIITKGKEGAINANFFSNHDIGRITARFYRPAKQAFDYEQQKLIYALTNMVQGNFFWYYGDEIGMIGTRQGNDDSFCRAAFLWGNTKYRTDPMVAGEDQRTLEYFEDQGKQIKDKNSLFSYVHNITRIRDIYPEIAHAPSIRQVNDDEQILIIQKTYNGSTIKIVINLSENDKTIDMEGELKDSLLVDITKKVKLKGGQLQLPHYSIAIIK